jgi:5-methylcytosine-specific restriction endonuclease McrA
MARIRRKKYRKQRVFKRMSSNIKRFDKVKIPAIELWKIAKKQKCKCALTGRRLTNENISIDHITPQALGGKTSLENIRFVIREANNAKWILTDKDLLELAKDIVKTLS